MRGNLVSTHYHNDRREPHDFEDVALLPLLADTIAHAESVEDVRAWLVNRIGKREG